MIGLCHYDTGKQTKERKAVAVPQEPPEAVHESIGGTLRDFTDKGNGYPETHGTKERVEVITLREPQFICECGQDHIKLLKSLEAADMESLAARLAILSCPQCTQLFSKYYDLGVKS